MRVVHRAEEDSDYCTVLDSCGPNVSADSNEMNILRNIDMEMDTHIDMDTDIDMNTPTFSSSFNA